MRWRRLIWEILVNGSKKEERSKAPLNIYTNFNCVNLL